MPPSDKPAARSRPKQFKEIDWVKKVMATFRKAADDDQRPDFRRRQLKKDDALRRRIELELSRKRLSGSRVFRKGKATPGTVMYLKPGEPILCKRSTTAYEAARLMSARRENCVLVVDNEGHLEGIFTAKDLAFRIVGASLSANAVTIDQIMTPDPVCTHVNSPSHEALNLMVEKGFRHLPILDDKEAVVGVLDITKAYAQQMEKLERLHDSSHKLYEALDNVHSEMDLSDQPRHVFEYFNDLKLKMDGPTIDSVLDDSTVPVMTNNRTSVYEATILMKKHKTTAVLIRDPNEGVTGIFTSKDVVLRVISAGLDPKNCSLVRVMTPRPDVVLANTTIQNALRRMFDGHYLNLPIEEDGEIVAIVDVLKLTYATLNQIKKISSNVPQEPFNPEVEEQQGPAWNKFWTTLDNEDSASAHSGSHPSDFHLRQSDITPQDSVSLVNADRISSPQTPLLLNEGEFVFKFKSPVVPERVHRITLKQDGDLHDLRGLINNKLDVHEVEALTGSGPASEPASETFKSYALSYRDDDGDLVSLTTDDDLVDCIYLNKAMNIHKADLFLHESHEKFAASKKSKLKERAHKELPGAGYVPGVPNALLLSGAVGFVSILAAALYVRNRR